jgi:hypothetical protein
MATELEGFADTHGADKLEQGYLPHYEYHIGYLRHEPITLLELGIWHGASLRMWEAWFSKARIIGVDINPAFHWDTARVESRNADATMYVPSEGYDIVVDDASHEPADISASHTNIWPFVKPGGWYVVEDMSFATYGQDAFSDVLYRGMAHQDGDIITREVYPSAFWPGRYIVFLQKCLSP